ncbi:NAD-dependent protein deacylase [Leucoagaricus sp. SymC.cos]|nr:NAD-dependent protein deacylase [Leucoagaricus sp. SymC.cos]
MTHVSPVPSSDLTAFCQILRSCKSVALLTGAGLSVASGQWLFSIRPSYNVAYVNIHVYRVASIQAWKEDPGRVWVRHHENRDTCLKTSPNVAHKLLATLSLPTIRNSLLPSLADPTKPPLYITQNIDGLCRRAIDTALNEATEADEMDQDAKELVRERHIEMHGSLYHTVCMQCKSKRWTDETLLAPIFADIKLEALNEEEKIPIDQLPRCGGVLWKGSNRYGNCGGLVRPGVVWFGEVPEGQGEIIRQITKVEVLLVIGTSSLVQPAASYAGTVKKNGGTVAVLNLESSPVDKEADFVFLGPCEETIPELFQKLKELAGSSN